MNLSLKVLGLAVALSLTSGAVQAKECFVATGNVKILSNDFPALHAVAKAAEACASDTLKVSKNQTKEHKDIQVAALTANPAEYTVAIVANSTLVTLMNDGLVRPLNDYVAKYGQDLGKNQLITINGDVMAVAFMANAQHLFYREDILKKAGVEVPTSYEEMVAAGKKIKEMGLMKNPLSGTYKSGWNLGEEFINMYMGTGADMFEKGSAMPAINNENGIAALNMMKQVTELMNPDFLTLDSNAVQADWEAGNVAMTVLWGSRAAGVLDDEGSTPEVVAATKFASAPTVGGGSTPATTLWWDGFAIAKNASDADAEASFATMASATSLDMAKANADDATWLIKGSTPTAKSVGVAASAAGGAQPYPMLPYAGLMHTALGNELSDFLQGKESAEQALKDVEAAYMTAAKEKGFIK